MPPITITAGSLINSTPLPTAVVSNSLTIPFVVNTA